MFKPHVAEILWGAIVVVTLENKWTEPPYRDGDGKKIHDLIKEVEQGYFAKQETDRKDTSKFQGAKNQVLGRHGFEGERRKFFSKVISTYESWMYHGTPDERKQRLDMVLSLPPAPHSVFT
jgi:hypothetical protein